MLIIGAGGFAKELLQVLEEDKIDNTIVLFDNINADVLEVFSKYKVLKNFEECKEVFSNNIKDFVLGIGNGKTRMKLADKFLSLGGNMVSVISSKAYVGDHIILGIGATILANATISNSAQIGKGLLMYYKAVITHDCLVGDYVELSPGATLLGNVEIGDFTQIGANATILPGLKIGKNVVVGAGAVVSRDLPDNCVAVGIPARIIKQY
ncbi:acetyltransferase [Myroides sp. N17-2]|uniref:acetyltransferase n=1 Tax=Myroides sp. N17-2 TaxID=2030799 RepID=UPI000EFA76AE|nr:acetyltransferase [Myroides sp. N17-2]